MRDEVNLGTVKYVSDKFISLDVEKYVSGIDVFPCTTKYVSMKLSQFRQQNMCQCRYLPGTANHVPHKATCITTTNLAPCEVIALSESSTITNLGPPTHCYESLLIQSLDSRRSPNCSCVIHDTTHSCAISSTSLMRTVAPLHFSFVLGTTKF